MPPSITYRENADGTCSLRFNKITEDELYAIWASLRRHCMDSCDAMYLCHQLDKQLPAEAKAVIEGLDK